MFVVHNQSGMPLQDAMDGKFAGLVGRDEEMIVRCNSTAISLRIQVHICLPLPLIDFWTKGLLTIPFTSPRSGLGINPGPVMYVYHNLVEPTGDLIHLQINTLDRKKPRGAITRSKLAYKITRAVGSFIEVS